MFFSKNLKNIRRAWVILTTLGESPAKADKNGVRVLVHEAIRDAEKFSDRLDKVARASRRVENSLSEESDAVRSRLHAVEKKLDLFLKEQKNHAGRGREHIVATEQKIGEVESQIDALRNFAQENSIELRRWQEGYDYKILAQYLKSTIEVVNNLERKIAGAQKRGVPAEVIAAYEFARDELTDLLENHGVERFAPECGGKIDLADPENRKRYQFSQAPTNDLEKDGTVSAIKEYGYNQIVNEGAEERIHMLSPAKVEYFKYQKPPEPPKTTDNNASAKDANSQVAPSVAEKDEVAHVPADPAGEAASTKENFHQQNSENENK